MNVTVRASLIALIAIVGACWAIPVLLVSVVPSDAGMIAMMALIYLVLPATAIALGLLAASSARTLFWLPAAMACIAPTIVQVNPVQNRLCSARQALPHMMYNRFDSAPGVFAGRSFTTGR